jgi:hypothetical protein
MKTTMEKKMKKKPTYLLTEQSLDLMEGLFVLATEAAPTGETCQFYIADAFNLVFSIMSARCEGAEGRMLSLLDFDERKTSLRHNVRGLLPEERFADEHDIFRCNGDAYVKVYAFDPDMQKLAKSVFRSLYSFSDRKGSERMVHLNLLVACTLTVLTVYDAQHGETRPVAWNNARRRFEFADCDDEDDDD